MLRKIIQKILEIIRTFEKSKNKWSSDKIIKGVMQGYKNNHGYEFDIYNPVLFTEKLQWYKIFYENENLTNIVDKYLFKQYIKEHLGDGYTIPLYGAWTSIADLERDWNNLPETFCLKSTLQSDGNFIKIIHKKSDVDFKELKGELKQWLKVKNTLINSYCRAYYNAVPRIIAEEFVVQINDQLYDYKFFCFSGKPTYAYVAKDHFESDDYSITFFDLDWNKLDVKYGVHTNDDAQKPYHYEEMLEISKKLSKDFPFVRVDFFDTKDKLYLAELTFYPGGGLTPYEPVSFNRLMGDMFVLPEHNKIS